MPIMLGPTGNVLLTPSGKVAIDPSCCCGESDLGCIGCGACTKTWNSITISGIPGCAGTKFNGTFAVGAAFDGSCTNQNDTLVWSSSPGLNTWGFRATIYCNNTANSATLGNGVPDNLIYLRFEFLAGSGVSPAGAGCIPDAQPSGLIQWRLRGDGVCPLSGKAFSPNDVTAGIPSVTQAGYWDFTTYPPAILIDAFLPDMKISVDIS